jgi:urea transport system permease protein
VATLFLIVAVPGLVAFVFGYFAFRSRIKGVYFSIITQAMTFAAMLLFFRNETGFGGNNGFTDFKRILGVPMATPSMRMVLFVLTGLTLLGFFLLARWLVPASSAACCRPSATPKPRDVQRLQPHCPTSSPSGSSRP